MKQMVVFLLAGMLLLSACGNANPTSSSSVLQSSTADSSSQMNSAPKQELESVPEPNPAPASELAPAPEPELTPEPEIDNSWQTDTPENHGMNPAVFRQMHESLVGSTVYAMVTAKDGVLIDEYYQDGYDENSKFPLYSCSKSFTSALLGIAIEQGFIGGVDDPLSNYLPQVVELQDGKQNLTLLHLLTQTSGLEWYEWGGGYSNWEEFQAAPNWVEYILGRNQAAPPGAVFNYSTGNTHLVSVALERATGMNELEFGREHLFGPLGMESVQWLTDPQGITDGGNGIVMTLRDAARFGQLYLQGGEWQGKQLVPADWVESSTAAQTSTGDGISSYGYFWWIRPFGGYDTYYAFGGWGQYIFVVPELNLVTVIANAGPSNISRAYFTDYVLAAVQEDT